MKTRLSGSMVLLMLLDAANALAISKPAPGTDPALHAHPAGASRMTIGAVVAVAVAIVTALWWAQSRSGKGSSGK